MRRAALAAAAALAMSATQAQETFHAEDTRNWGSPRRVLPPDYPPEAIARKHTGHVDFEGIVTAVENIDVLQYRPDSEASNVFVEPLKKAIPHWRYHIVIGTDCLPSTQPLWTRVWFELDGDKPKISVSLRDPAAIARGRQLKETSRWDPVYPRSMQYAGYQANVFARMALNAEGEVTEVTAKAYPQAPGVSLADFLKSTERHLLRWKFPPALPGEGQRIVCKQVFFRLRD